MISNSPQKAVTVVARRQRPSSSTSLVMALL